MTIPWQLFTYKVVRLFIKDAFVEGSLRGQIIKWNKELCTQILNNYEIISLWGEITQGEREIIMTPKCMGRYYSDKGTFNVYLK